MNIKNFRIYDFYLRLFNFVAANRLGKADIDPRAIHSHLAVVLSTAPLTWGYTILSFLTMESPILGITGLVCSTIHLSSPFLYRVTNSSFLAASVLLCTGLVHQNVFAYYSGGFSSNVLIWCGILPILAGVINGKRGAITWMYLSLLSSMIFFILHLKNYPFPVLISPKGEVWSQALLVFGWTFLSTTIVVVYTGLRQHTEMKLKDQGQKIDDLFRVLFHDLANPLGRIAIGLSIAKRQMPSGEQNRGLEIAQFASDSMMEITQNVRKMYAVSKGKTHLNLTYTTMNSAVSYILKVYSAELERKNIKVNYDFENNKGLNLKLESVSFNNQVLGNIISNAIKFSPENSFISITVYPLSKSHFKIEISDQGIGMPKTIMDNIFDLNKKTSRPGTNGEMGTGFGMHIMKSFVEMYEGEVSIESHESSNTLPSGTTVKLILKGEWKS